ncbi:MAG: hypothetical protein HC768_13290 [Acaryochloris sp. CRU_2_0]|nr:hypothetical protein [Acaryochloris sp. CRU_2_0]
MFSLLIFRRFVSFEVAWLLAGILSSFVSYPALPKPRVGIVKYFLTIQGALLASLVGLFFIPPLLQTVMPAFWAYVLPLLLLANAIYFVPPLDGSSRGAWWKWIVSSFVVAGLYGWFMGSLKR